MYNLHLFYRISLKKESFSASGNERKGEEVDFVLENLNRKSIRFMPPGLPSDDKWLTICRNIDKLNQVI